MFADTYGLGSFIHEYRHYMVAKWDDHGGYQVFCTNADNPSELIKMRYENGGNDIHVTGNGVVRYNTHDYGITWSSGTQIGQTFWPINVNLGQPILESTFNVLRPSGTVFFYQTAPPIMILVETMKGVDSGMILKIILAGLIPLAGCLILGISFRKGWAFLRNQLTH
ncbi:MAG TPA: hypothetical protein VJY12_00975 [Dysgonamonadaceae bacterium]|nr:hypothetical protein [Dysgonamonadaceae bacterium]